MTALLATMVVAAVLTTAVVGIRAAAHQRHGARYDVTARRLASSLSLALVGVAATRSVILADLAAPSAGDIAATHAANVAVVAAIGWWVWTLWADGVIALSRPDPPTPSDAAAPPAPGSWAPTRPAPVLGAIGPRTVAGQAATVFGLLVVVVTLIGIIAAYF